MDAQRELDRRPLRFGVFELNPGSGELRKHGVRIRLQDQPLKLLLCLLESPGEIRTREHLIRSIWPEGTFVDYERGLNVAITRLRQVLGDTADSPRYIETVGRRGYRFIAPLEAVAETASPPLERRPTEPPAAAPPPAKRLSPSRWWAYAAVLGIGFAAGAAAIWWRHRPAAPPPLIRLSVDLAGKVLAAHRGTVLALSPDGTRLAITVQDADGNLRLATRRLDQPQFAPLAGTEGAASPFFSPDGQWIAFFAEGRLKKIPVQGGAPVALAEASTIGAPLALFPSGSWGDDGNIVAMLNPVNGLSRIPSAGASPEPLTASSKGEDEIDNWPQVLPGSQSVLFTRQRADYDTGTIAVLSLRTGAVKTVLHGGFLARYLPSGHLVYVRENTLYAARFDLGTLSVSGNPQPVLEDVGSRLGWWTYDFSRSGSFVYSQPGNPQLSLFWLDRAGKLLPLRTDAGASYDGPRFSPDGRRLAFAMGLEGHRDIWVQELDRASALRLTALPGVNDTPVWTGDGASIIFRSADQPQPGLYAVRTDGSGDARRIADFSAGEFPYSVSPDGKRLIIWDRRGGGRLWTAPVESSGGKVGLGKAEPLLQNRFRSPVPGRAAPSVSPDGRWIAYCANDSGRLEVYVAPFPGPGGRTHVSSNGGKFPIWSRHSRELFFLELDSSRIMVTSYEEKGGTFVAGPPRVWSERHLLDLGRIQSYDLAPDGKRFAVVLYADGTAEREPVTSVTFLLNFFDELRRRVPVRGR